MSNTSRLIFDIEDVRALNEALRHHLQGAENCLNSLVNKREKLARLANQNKWDVDQYLFDDLQQELADIIEKLADFAPLPRPLEKFIAA